MESKIQSIGKKDDSLQGDSFSTYSNSGASCVYGSVYDFSPHWNRLPKRAKSLKQCLRKTNIDFPDVRAPFRYDLPLSPLPEPVEEDESEENYVNGFLLLD